jgi:hypothetical protein
VVVVAVVADAGAKVTTGPLNFVYANVRASMVKKWAAM